MIDQDQPQPARKPTRGTGYTQAVKDQCQALYESNRELKAIQNAIGPNVSSITSWARTYGWKRNRISEDIYSTHEELSGGSPDPSVSSPVLKDGSGIEGERLAQRSVSQTVHVDANERLIASHKDLLSKLHKRVDELLEASHTGKSSPAKYLLDLARAIRDVIGLERTTYGLDAHHVGPVPVILLPIKSIDMTTWQTATAKALGVQVSDIQQVGAIDSGQVKEN